MSATELIDPVQNLSNADCLRVCRDIAWCEIAEMPGLRAQLGTRINAAVPYKPVNQNVLTQAASQIDGQTDSQLEHASRLRWDKDPLLLDSLARLQLATVAATWCNAFETGHEDLFIAKRSVAQWVGVMQQVLALGTGFLTFSTSGSTGTRKHVRHPSAVLWAEAHAWVSVLGNAIPVRRLIVLCPTHHLYGFIWGVLLPQVLGVPVVDADLASLPPLTSGDLVVAVPDQWSWLAESSRHWPAGVQGISSTAPLPAAVHQALVAPAAPRLARLFQIYGATETAGLAYRTDPAAPYRLAPPCSRSTSGSIARRLPNGVLVCLDVQDTLAWVTDADADAGFHIQQRKDHSVQVGGHNVSPAWVAAQLRLHPDVREASVRLNTQTLPPRLKAFVVFKALSSSAHRLAFEQWTAEQLPWYAHFSSITYGEEVPVNVLGKPSDWPE